MFLAFLLLPKSSEFCVAVINRVTMPAHYIQNKIALGNVMEDAVQYTVITLLSVHSPAATWKEGGEIVDDCPRSGVSICCLTSRHYETSFTHGDNHHKPVLLKIRGYIQKPF